MIDWRVGRLVRSVITTANVLGDDIDLRANQQRVALIVSCQAVDLVVNNDTIRIDVDTKTIISQFASFGPIYLSITSHGDLVTRAINVGTILGSIALSVTELLMPEDYLAAGLKEFESQYNLESPYGNTRPPNV